MLQKKYKYDIEYFDNENYAKLQDLYNQKLMQSGIPQDYFNGKMLRENPKLYAETQEKAHDVLRKMVPSHSNYYDLYLYIG